MYLDKLFVFNYKSCRHLELSVSQNSPNIFIGLNDSGKSTVLQAFDLLLGDKPKYSFLGEGNYKSDLSNSPKSLVEINEILKDRNLPFLNYEGDATVLLGKLHFENEEGEEFGEMNLSAPLKWSIDSNEDNSIWVAKKFSSQGTSIYLLFSESDPESDLWNLPQAELNKKIKELEITPAEIENENGKGRFSNFEKMRAIYAKMDCSLKWAEYKFAKNDKDVFPVFNLFDWNTSLDEINSIANAIMQDEIDIHLKPLKTQASKSAEEAEKAINEKFGEISKIIKEVATGVESIKSKVYFDVREKISDIMLTKSNSDGFIHLENQGEGLKRQIWFSLIKVKANESNEERKKFIWAFDEPETHLYPGAQRDFFDILNKLSKGDVQSIISTHSTIFIDKSNLNSIGSVKQDGTGYTVISNCEDIEAIYSSLNVKNSDFLFYNKFLVVEGDTEQYLIPKLYELYTNSTLINDNIQLINIQGKNKWTQNKGIIDKIMSGFQKTEDNIVYLFDNDMSFEIGAAVITENMFFVGQQDIEDSIKDEIWLELLNDYYKDILVFKPEEIAVWKESVVKDGKCSDYEKFYPILKKGIKEKYEKEDVDYEILKKVPSKGADSAEFLIKFIVKPEDIPEKITDAFDKLNRENDDDQDKPEA